MAPRQIDTDSPGLVDGCGRRIDHLRLSVTPACGLRCLYCRPPAPSANGPGALTDSQRLDIIRFLHERYGLSQVRFTGGEPLLYPNLAGLVAAVRGALPDVALAVTTNGRELARRAVQLRQAGLDRLNVSLDSLDAERYHRITGGRIADVFEGLRAARRAGFPPPRINTVVLRGENLGEVCHLTQWALSNGLEIRFLEAMPIGLAAEYNRRNFVPAAEIRDRLASSFEVAALPDHGGATARRFQVRRGDLAGVVGLITPASEPFCGGCRRVRLTAGGRLYPCLLDSRYVDLGAAWRAGRLDRVTAAALVEAAVAAKQPGGSQRQAASMVTLGG